MEESCGYIRSEFNKFRLKDETIINYILSFGGLEGYMLLATASFSTLVLYKNFHPQNDNKICTYRVKNDCEVEYIEEYDCYIRKNANLYEKGDFIGHMKNKTVISKIPDGKLSHICDNLQWRSPKKV